jgi:hypothetical protein
MKNRFLILSLTLVPFVFFACDFFETKEGNGLKKEKIARVGKIFLYKDDIEKLSLVPALSSAEDSSSIVSRYVDKWVKKQLLVQAAEQDEAENIPELERRLLEYKYQLLVHGFKKRYVESTLDTLINEQEIQEYYLNNQANFELKQNIVRVFYSKVPKDAPRLDELKSWMRAGNSTDLDELRSYCHGFAASYSLSDSTWLVFDDLVSGIPIKKGYYPQKNQYLEASDSVYFYFLRINDVKIEDQTSPLEFVKDQISAIIMNKRKINLQNKLENDIYKKALSENMYEVY